MSWINDDELNLLRTEHRQFKNEVVHLKETVKRIGLLGIAGIKLLRGQQVPEWKKLMEDALFLIAQHCTGYKKPMVEMLLDVPPTDYAPRPQPALPPPSEE